MESINFNLNAIYVCFFKIIIKLYSLVFKKVPLVLIIICREFIINHIKKKLPAPANIGH